MKKILTLSLMLISTSMSAADISGVYVGADLAKSIALTHRKNIKSDRYDGLDGFDKGAHIKIQKDFQNIVLALENLWVLSNAKGKHPNEKFTKKNGIEFSLNIGTKLGDSLVYGKIGYSNSKFCFKKYNIPAGHRGIYRDKINKRIQGMVLGAGFETPLDSKKKWFGGAEYSYTLFKEANFKFYEKRKISHKVNTGNFLVKVNYKM